MPNVPTFQTPRLTLREVVEEDASSYERYFVNYEVVRNLAAGVPWPYPQGGIIEFLRSQILPQQGEDKWMWAITLKEKPSELIGAIELLRIASPTNRGFWLGEPFWGRGYMTEAIEPINDYAFNILGFERLLFKNAVGNHRSRRIKEKTGARFIRRVPSAYVDPLFTESEVFELTAEDWLNRKQ